MVSPVRNELYVKVADPGQVRAARRFIAPADDCPASYSPYFLLPALFPTTLNPIGED